MPTNSLPRYVCVPLKHDEPKNYWTSPTGLDLCAIPLPPEIGHNADLKYFSEKQLVTPEMSSKSKVQPGLVTCAVCNQPEYLDAIDFSLGRTLPTMRFGHISRVGFFQTADGRSSVRPHVIDMHASPGNSGATVLVYVPGEGLTSAAMFLGVVLGYAEETSSYQEYKAPIRDAHGSISLCLVSNETGRTNKVAIVTKTLANPNLTFVTPVHELARLRESLEFMTAAYWMGSHKSAYETFSNLPVGPSSHVNKTTNSVIPSGDEQVAVFCFMIVGVVFVCGVFWFKRNRRSAA